MSDPKPAVVRPFGSLGAAYEVDTAVLRIHQAGQAAAALVAGVIIFRRQIGLSNVATLVLFVAALIVLASLSVVIARKGRKP